MLFSITSFVTLLAAASTVAAQPSKRSISINPPQNLRVDLTALPPAEVGPVTNAKRFAQGLPPLSPVKRRPHRGGPHRDGDYPHKGTRVELAPRTEASPSVQTKINCNILVKTTSGSTLGYISPVFNDFGEYGTPQSNQSGALEISFSTASHDSVYGPADFLVTNNADTINSFPYLSVAVGFMSDSDDLGPGSPNYAVITGNSGSAGAGATPSSSTKNSYVTRTGMSANSETAIWTYNPATQDIRVVWTNTDMSSAPTKLVYFVDPEAPAEGDTNTLVAAGDLAAFQGTFGCTDTCPEVTFTCVPPA